MWEGGMGVIANRYEFLWGNENVLELDCGGIFMIVNMLNST